MCIETYRELAEQYSATIVTDSRVDNILVEQDMVKIQSTDHVFKGDALVVSAGARSGSLLSQLNLNLPLNPVRKTFAWFEADEVLYNEKEFPAFTFNTSEGMYYGFPSIDGAGLKVGRHDGGEPINPDHTLLEFGKREEDAEDVTTFYMNSCLSRDN